MLVTETGRRTFDKAAEDYDAVRPGYPPALLAALIDAAQLTPRSRVLEIACGTGQLTRDLGAAGPEVLAIDIGENLLTIARERCAAWPNVRFRRVAFEALDDASAFDALTCATAFHWLDPQTRWQRAAHLLRPGGTLAIVQNINQFGIDTGGLQPTIAEIYRRIIPTDQLKIYQEHEARTDGLREEFEACGFFGPVTARRFPFTHTLSADDYPRLTNSFSYQHNLPARIKDRLFGAIHEAILAAGGFIHLAYKALLLTARTHPA